MMVQWDLLIVGKVGKGLGHRVVHGKFKQLIWGIFALKEWIFSSLKHEPPKTYGIMVLRKQARI